MAFGVEAARVRLRLVLGTGESVDSMPREQLKWKPHKSQRTDGSHRGGMPRSSDEGGVMQLEQRGHARAVSASGLTVRAGRARG